MKTTYRLIARRRVEGALRFRLRTPSRASAAADDPTEMPIELVDLATDELAARRQPRRRRAQVGRRSRASGRGPAGER
jgi:hypothetical protein